MIKHNQFTFIILFKINRTHPVGLGGGLTELYVKEGKDFMYKVCN